jgi:TRAP-type C4-dicarboxylate transport system permease large subunit
MRGSFPFLCSDGVVLFLVMLFPIMTLWLPNLAVQSVFN